MGYLIFFEAYRTRSFARKSIFKREFWSVSAIE